MNPWRKLRNALCALTQKPRLDKEMDAEMRSHIEMRADENIAAGMNSEEARTEAMRRFGQSEAIKEACRDQRGVSWIENAAQDFRYGLRALGNQPGFATTAILTIAIGIGSCTALFSVVNGVLLQPLPLPNPEQVVALNETSPPNRQFEAVTPAAYLDWVKQNSVFSHLGAFRGRSYTTKMDGVAATLGGLSVTADYFHALGVQPIRGRGFLPEEESPGKDHVAVLSYREWQNHFGGSEKVINQTITLNDQPYTIVGVLPEGNIPWNAPLFTPLTFSPADRHDYGSHGLACVGRLKSGVTLAEAQADMAVVSDRIASAHPDSNLGRGAAVVSLLDSITGSVRLQLMILLFAVGCLLLIACVNVASMLLARAHARQKEIAVRSALGASRGRIVRQFIIEGLLVAVSGGFLGGMMAYASLGLVSRFSSQYVPRTTEISLDPQVFGVIAGLMLVVGLGVGLVPAFQFSRRDLAEPLKDSGRSASSGRKSQRLRASLVTAEIALATVLLVGTGLLARSLMALQRAELGFKTDNLFIAPLSFAAKKYETRERLFAFVNDAMAQVSALPKVQAVAFADDMPLVSYKGLLFSVVGAPEIPVRNLPGTSDSIVTSDYFRAMSIPLLQGRDFSARDTANSPRVVLINEQLARIYFPGVNPVGRRLNIYTMANEPDVEREIIGVVGNVRPFGPQSALEPQVYEPLAQIPQRGLTLIVKSTGTSHTLPSEVVNIVRALDPDLPFPGLSEYHYTIADAWSRQRFMMILLTLFSAIALVLAAVGIYGVMAYSVSQRTQEIGIRMALGARVSDVLRLVTSSGAKIVAAGLLLGAGGSIAFAQMLRSLLFNTSPIDPVTLLSVCGLLTIVAGLACWLPARRAAKVDPAVALRDA